MCKIKEIMNDTLDLWPLAIISRSHKVKAEVVEPVHEFQPILPELWQDWMAREIATQQIVQDHIDYLEAMERRDKITEALIVLRSEAAALNMHYAISKIADAGAAILDELWRQGDLGD